MLLALLSEFAVAPRLWLGKIYGCGTVSQPDVFAAMAVRRGDLLEIDAAASDGSGLTTLLFDADLLGLGAFDLTTCGEALIAKHTQGFDFRTLPCLFTVFQHFEIAWAGHTIFIDSLFPLGIGRHSTRSLPMC